MKLSKTYYPDGSFYTTIDYVEVLKHQKLTFRINSFDDLWQLKQIKDVCDHNKVKVDLTIPNLFCAQEDRRFNSNESSGLKLVCQFINDMKWESVSIFHPHNQEVVLALIDNVKIIDNKDFILSVFSKLYTGLTQQCAEKELILTSVDGGGFKPLMKLCDKIGWKGETYSASKSRKYEDGKSKLIQLVDRQDFGDKDILLVDDISVYGGTFIGLAKMLRERNCGKLYLAVSHLTVEHPNNELFTSFDRVFTTNSKGLEYRTGHKPFEEVPKNLETINLF